MHSFGLGLRNVIYSIVFLISNYLTGIFRPVNSRCDLISINTEVSLPMLSSFTIVFPVVGVRDHDPYCEETNNIGLGTNKYSISYYNG